MDLGAAWPPSSSGEGSAPASRCAPEPLRRGSHLGAGELQGFSTPGSIFTTRVCKHRTRQAPWLFPPQPNHRGLELFGYTINFFWGGLGCCLPGWSLSVPALPSVIPSRFPEQRQFRVQRCLWTGAWRHGFLFSIGSEGCALLT